MKKTQVITSANETALLAGKVSMLIQQGHHDGETSVRTAYRILGMLGLANYSESLPPMPTENT